MRDADSGYSTFVPFRVPGYVPDFGCSVPSLVPTKSETGTNLGGLRIFEKKVKKLQGTPLMIFRKIEVHKNVGGRKFRWHQDFGNLGRGYSTFSNL